MGRPQRADKERPDSTNSLRKSQPANSPESLALNESSSESASKDFASNGNAWLDHDLEEAIDPNLMSAQCHGSLGFELHGTALQDDQLHMSLSEDCFNNCAFEFDSSQVPRDLSNLGMFGLETEETDGSLQPSPLVTVSNVAAEASNIKSILNDTVPQHSVSKQQESVEKISNLNLELRRQLNIVSMMAKEPSHPEPSQMGLLDKTNSLSCAIVLMIQGLQTFHDLLAQVLGPTSPTSHEEAKNHATMHNSQNHQSIQKSFRQSTSPYYTSMLSLTSTKDDKSGDSRSESVPKSQTVSRSETSLRFRPTEEAVPEVSLLDMSTSLLIISCYISLIHLCRDVFAAIRRALSASDQDTSLFTLSGFQISGVSIQQDSDLQIIVLTQVVVRLVDRIGLSLGRPSNPTTEVGNRDGANHCNKAILPQLLDFLLRQDGVGDQLSANGGIKALREEIRRLNDVVYKPV